MSKILMFKASWCGPCKVMEPIIREVSKERNISVIYLDADTNPEELSKWVVRAVPTIIFLDQDDRELHRISGAISKQELEILVDNL